MKISETTQILYSIENNLYVVVLWLAITCKADRYLQDFFILSDQKFISLFEVIFHFDIRMNSHHALMSVWVKTTIALFLYLN